MRGRWWLWLAVLPMLAASGAPSAPLLLGPRSGGGSSGGGGGGSSVLEAAATAMSPGTWHEITDSTGFSGLSLPNSIVGSNPSNVLEDTDRLVYSEIEKKVYFLGCARGWLDPPYECSNGSTADSSGLISYDLATNHWARDNSSGMPVHTNSHAYDYLFMRQSDGTVYYCEDIQNTSDHFINARNLAGTWSDIAMPAGGTASDQAIGFAEACEYFPERDTFVYIDGGNDNNRPASGSMYYPKIIERSRTTNNWTGHTVTTTLAQMIGYIENFSRYSPQRQRIYFGGGSASAGVGGDKLWMYLPDGSFVQGADSPVGLGTHASSGKQAINPANGNLIALENNPPNIYEFDPSTDADGTWTDIGDHPLSVGSSPGFQMFAVLTTIPASCVIFVWNLDDQTHTEHLWLFKPPECSSSIAAPLSYGERVLDSANDAVFDVRMAA